MTTIIVGDATIFPRPTTIATETHAPSVIAPGDHPFVCCADRITPATGLGAGFAGKAGEARSPAPASGGDEVTITSGAGDCLLWEGWL